MAYRKFDTGTWQDPWFEDLGPKAKLAFIYLWTNDTCNQAGVYKISKRRMEFELGFSVNGVIETLADKIYWDPERQIVWVKNFVKWQCQNQSFFTAALKIVAEMPEDIQAEFVKYNQRLIDQYGVEVSNYDVTTNPPPTPHSVYTNPASEQSSTEQKQSRAEAEDGSELHQGSSEQPASTKPDPLLKIPLITKEEYPIFQEDIDEWQDAYPAVDILQELKNIRQWNLSNPKKQKTPKGIRKHITNWLAKEQDRGGNGRYPPTSGKDSTLSPKQQHNARVLQKVKEDLYGGS